MILILGVFQVSIQELGVIFFIFRGFLGLLGEFVIEIRYKLVLKNIFKKDIKFYDNYNFIIKKKK